MIRRYTIESLECKRTIEPEKIERYRLDYKIDYGDRKLIKKEKLLEVKFTFNIFYLKDIGSIKVQGKIYFSDTIKKLNEIDKNWGNDKEIQRQAINTLFKNIIAMVFDTTRHMGLPPPAVLPQFSPEGGA